MNSVESIGRRVKRLRMERGLTQRDLRADGVSYAYVSRIESGDRVPSVKAIRIMARKLGVTPEYLETGVDPPDLIRIRRLLQVACAKAEGAAANTPFIFAALNEFKHPEGGWRYITPP